MLFCFVLLACLSSFSVLASSSFCFSHRWCTLLLFIGGGRVEQGTGRRERFEMRQAQRRTSLLPHASPIPLLSSVPPHFALFVIACYCCYRSVPERSSVRQKHRSSRCSNSNVKEMHTSTTEVFFLFFLLLVSFIPRFNSCLSGI